MAILARRVGADEASNPWASTSVAYHPARRWMGRKEREMN